MDEIEAAQQAQLNRPQPTVSRPQPTDDPDFAAGLAAAQSGQGPLAIMLAQPTIANDQRLLDTIASSYGLPAGLSAQEIQAQSRGALTKTAASSIARALDLPPGLNRAQLLAAFKKQQQGVKEGKKPEHNLGTGWMLAKDKELGKKVAQNIEKARREKELMQKYAGKKDIEEAKRPDRAMPATDLRVGDRVVADTSKENYPGGHKQRVGIVTRVGQKGVHIRTDDSDEPEWHPYKIVKKVSVDEARQSAAVKLGKAWDQQKAKSAASRERAKELLNPVKKDQEKKNG
jgi:hypothetical protein